jgi:prepilin-type N-terminal cleavage/methylation domain-containing protein
MNKGVTLVELLVSISVMVIMSAALLVNWHPAQDSFALRRSAANLSADLKRAQQSSLSTKEFNCSSSPGEEYDGFGIYLTTNTPVSYQMYENCSADYVWNSGEEIEVLNLENGVEINSLKVGGVSVTTLNLLFIPPNPDVYINSEKVGKEAIIELSNDSSTTTVKINNSGKIE